METLFEIVAWLMDHSLHQDAEAAPSHHSERAARGWFDPLEVLGFDRLSYRAPWDALS